MNALRRSTTPIAKRTSQPMCFHGQILMYHHKMIALGISQSPMKPV
ncbi:UNVERIFIED_CONTAM: hypothetical protein GTU68_014725 [Idotea baltica]|nr:hypothetical protein [Idotea baltica]